MDFSLFMKGALRRKLDMADKLLGLLPERVRLVAKAFGAQAAAAIVEALGPYAKAEAAPLPAAREGAPRKVDIG